MNSTVKISITFNNLEWIPAPDFRFLDHKILKIVYANEYMAEWGDLEQREKKWMEEEPEEEPPQGKNDKETAKLIELQIKKSLEQTMET